MQMMPMRRLLKLAEMDGHNWVRQTHGWSMNVKRIRMNQYKSITMNEILKSI